MEAFGAIVICHNCVAKKLRLDANSSLLSSPSSPTVCRTRRVPPSSGVWRGAPAANDFDAFLDKKKVLMPLQSTISCCIGVARKLSLVEIPILNHSTPNSLCGPK